MSAFNIFMRHWWEKRVPPDSRPIHHVCFRARLLLAWAVVFGASTCWAQGTVSVEEAPLALSPSEAVKRFKVAAGLQIELVVSEPQVSQPLSISFDDRGRMWVLQYRQFPNPKGLKAVKVDQFLRTKYDKLPDPPPKGPKGNDRISIYEDTNGDGRADTVKHFLSDLNLASGMALGYGGVYVVQPPYLLFYADRNRDDVPDGDPEVLLRGFGMEDAHAFANSLTWGPDGWLYGAQGSTATANIRGIGFQQGVWRFHPRTKQFELFAERLCRRQPDRRICALPRRRVPPALSRGLHCPQHASQCEPLEHAGDEWFDICHTGRRRLHHHQRHLVPPGRFDRGA